MFIYSNYSCEVPLPFRNWFTPFTFD